MATGTKPSDFKKGHIQDLVFLQLSFDVATRDNDELLCTNIWERELNGENEMFFARYRNGRLPSAEAIVRARRILQKDHPYLRGSNHEKRQVHSGKVRASFKDGGDPNEG